MDLYALLPSRGFGLSAFQCRFKSKFATYRAVLLVEITQFNWLANHIGGLNVISRYSFQFMADIIANGGRRCRNAMDQLELIRTIRTLVKWGNLNSGCTNFVGVVSYSIVEGLSFLKSNPSGMVFCPVLGGECYDKRWNLIVYSVGENFQLTARYIDSTEPLRVSLPSSGEGLLHLTFHNVAFQDKLPAWVGNRPLAADKTNCGLIVCHFVAGYICAKLGKFFTSIVI